MATSELLHTPSSREPGVKADRLVTKQGKPAQVGERAYDKHTGRLAQVGLSQQVEFISSRADSHASPSPKPDEGKERKTTAISGLKCFGLFENFGQLGSSVKMLRDSLVSAEVWYSNKCALTWKAKVTKFKRSLYQLSPSMRRTEGIGSGLLPTAQASDPTQGSVMGKDDTFYETKTGMPRKVNRNGKDGSVGLPRLLQLLPTASTVTAVGSGTGLKLQPAFALWMMGYPTDWLDLEDGEMPHSKGRATRGFRKSPKKFSKRLKRSIPYEAN